MEATMLEALWLDTLAWWPAVPPAFAFLQALPFAVAALGLVADCVRRRCGRA